MESVRNKYANKRIARGIDREDDIDEDTLKKAAEHLSRTKNFIKYGDKDMQDLMDAMDYNGPAIPRQDTPEYIANLEKDYNEEINDNTIIEELEEETDNFLPWEQPQLSVFYGTISADFLIDTKNYFPQKLHNFSKINAKVCLDRIFKILPEKIGFDFKLHRLELLKFEKIGHLEGYTKKVESEFNNNQIMSMKKGEYKNVSPSDLFYRPYMAFIVYITTQDKELNDIVVDLTNKITNFMNSLEADFIYKEFGCKRVSEDLFSPLDALNTLS